MPAAKEEVKPSQVDMQIEKVQSSVASNPLLLKLVLGSGIVAAIVLVLRRRSGLQSRKAMEEKSLA